MSAYRWRVKKAWIGVVSHEDKLLGVIRRSGIVRATGHFCSVEVSIEGIKYFASGAEDRIHPFHSIRLLRNQRVPKLELTAVGWCVDGNTFAFRNKENELVEITHAGCAPHNTEPITQEVKTA